jgi:hypothetical protein
MRPSSPNVGYHICFPRVVVDFKVVILDKLETSSLPKIKVWLYENILQTLMIRIGFTSLFHKVIPPNLESANHSA